MFIHFDSCAPRETLVVSTGSSVYELIVLPGAQGAVLVRGGRHFPDFRPAVFLGSTASDGRHEPRAIEVGMRMILVAGGRFTITSPVQSASRVPASSASASSPAA